MRQVQFKDFEALKGLHNAIRVRAATTANITVSTALNAGDTLDGVTLAAGDAVLVKDQSTASGNGIYIVAADPYRHPDFSAAERNNAAAYDTHAGLTVTVMEGTTNADTMWVCTSNKGGALGTDNIVFAQLALPNGMNPVGAVVDYAGTTPPSGWLLCYGQAVSRTTYAALFAVLSTTYGAGDGSTTFNVPDLRGRVVAGQDDMGGSSANRLTGASGGVDGDTLGASGGAETHTLTTAQMPSHTHTIPYTDQAVTGGAVNSVGGTDGTVNSGSAGSDQAHNNVQPTFILNKIIFAGV